MAGLDWSIWWSQISLLYSARNAARYWYWANFVTTPPIDLGDWFGPPQNLWQRLDFQARWTSLCFAYGPSRPRRKPCLASRRENQVKWFNPSWNGSCSIWIWYALDSLFIIKYILFKDLFYTCFVLALNCSRYYCMVWNAIWKVAVGFYKRSCSWIGRRRATVIILVFGEDNDQYFK